MNYKIYNSYEGYAIRNKDDDFICLTDTKEKAKNIVKALEKDIQNEVLEIIRCKDCIHSKKHVQIIQEDGTITHLHRFCEIMYPDMGFEDDDYCSYGKIKEELL